MPKELISFFVCLSQDNAKRGLLQMDDRMLLYNNSRDYQENSTAIDPAAVAWTHIQVLNLFIFSVLYINICLVSCSIHNR